MAEIEAYTKAAMDGILDDTIQSLQLVGTTPNQILRATLQDGTTEDLGVVSGAQGPQGYTGSGIAGVEPLFSSVIPGPWVPIVTTDEWTTDHGAPNWANLRYRLVGDMVELNGWAKYVGQDESDDPQVFHTSSVFTDMSGNLTPALPAEMMPAAGQYRSLHAQRYGRYPAQVTIGTPAPGYHLFQYNGADQPPLKKEEWISFTGCMYVI